MKNIDSYSHVRGESVYVDDILELDRTLHLSAFGSPVAHGKIISIDTSRAENAEGVHMVLLADDIPGNNQIGGIIEDEPLLAEHQVHFIGQPIAIVVAESPHLAKKAKLLIEVEIEELPVITNPREAYTSGRLIQTPRTFELGDTNTIWKECDVIVENRVDIAGQEHLYLETQGAYSFITENDHLRIISSTQGPTAVQRTAAKLLGLPMHKIEVDVRRLGGGFGGKEDQATPWACMAAVATFITKRPTKLILDRHEDMYMTGKRHPYSADFKLGLTADGKIKGYEVTFYQNAGAAADLSPAVLERTLFHATNSYFIPNIRATGISCKTNLPPNTAFRGFGGPQGMFVIESALEQAAEEMGIPKWRIQEKNLLSDGDQFPYGQTAENPQIRNAWFDAKERYNLEEMLNKVETFNSKNIQHKKGISLMPITFGISFTNTSMNQAGSLVHIYQDGSIGVSTGAVEMGQGVNTRILQVPSRVFSVDPERVYIESTNTTRVANTSPSAASSTHDLNGKATEIACDRLKQRLLLVASSILGNEVDELSLSGGMVMVDGNQSDLTWNKLVEQAFLARVDLSEHAFYATPDIHFDQTEEKGHPFAYHSFGTAIVEVTVDCLRGTYEFDGFYVSHDFGKSMNPIIDLGQMEGGIVQGMGWMTSEELRYDDQGRLLSNALSTYKIPDLNAAPKQIMTHFLEDIENEYGLFKSKAIGEPPLMYGIGAYFAINHAVKAFNANHRERFNAPYTPEKVLLDLYDKTTLVDTEEVLTQSDVRID